MVDVFTALDYDGGTTHYALVVEVTDGTTTLEIPVDVTVNPVNEGTPTFGADADVTFAENTPIGTVIVTHAATDIDASPHDIETYAITAGLIKLFFLHKINLL